MTLPSEALDAAVKAAFAPSGTLRVGLIEAPAPGLIFVSRSADETLAGITADLAHDLAQRTELPLAVTLFPNSGAAAAALQAEVIDVSFMPVDAIRRQVLDFGPGYYDLESTYLASAASGITDVAQVDRPGVRVLAIDGTTTFRASARTLMHTQPVAVPSVAEAVAWMRAGQADASPSRAIPCGRWCSRFQARGSSRAASSRRRSPSLSQRAVPAPSAQSRLGWMTRSGLASSGGSSTPMGSAAIRSRPKTVQPADRQRWAC